MSLSNPYSSIPSTSRTKLNASADPADVAFLQRLIPNRHGFQNYVLATMFHRFITELRRLESESGEPFPPGWNIAHPTYILVECVLQRCNFDERGTDGGSASAVPGPATGQPDGPEPGGDVPGGTNSICPEMFGIEG